MYDTLIRVIFISDWCYDYSTWSRKINYLRCAKERRNRSSMDRTSGPKYLRQTAEGNTLKASNWKHAESTKMETCWKRNLWWKLTYIKKQLLIEDARIEPLKESTSDKRFFIKAYRRSSGRYLLKDKSCLLKYYSEDILNALYFINYKIKE